MVLVLADGFALGCSKRGGGGADATCLFLFVFFVVAVQTNVGTHFAVEVTLIMFHVEFDLQAANKAAAIVVMYLFDTKHILALVNREQMN